MNNNLNKKWVLLLLIILSVGINVYFRLNSLFLSYLDVAARKEVYAKLSGEINKNLTLSYPDINEQNRAELLNILFQDTLKQKKSEINRDILRSANELKGYYQDERGWTYLLEVDPYRWYRRVDNFLTLGHFGTRRINHQDYDNLMSAPLGREIEPLKLHFYIGVYFYKFLHFFNNRLTLMNCLSLLPVFLSAIMVVAIFAICTLFGISYLGSFVASLVIGLNPIILYRSSFGWFDTDIYTILMPLIIAITLAYSFKQKELKNRIFLVCGGFLFGLYSALWSIWWLFFYIFLAAFLFYKLNIISYDQKKSLSVKLKDSLLQLILFVFSTYLSVLFISGFGALTKSFSEPFFYLTLREALTLDNFWPNLAFSIAELGRADIKYIVNSLGTGIVFYSGILTLLLLVLVKRILADFKEKGFLFLILFTWLCVTFPLLNFVKRFIVFLAVPFGILFGVFLDMVRKYMFEQKNKFYLLKKVNKETYNLLLSGLFLMVSVIPLSRALEVVGIPMMNDSFRNMLAKVKELTPANAIINDYWDYGDYTMTIAKRATVLDAQYQWTPVTYWVTRALFTGNEAEAVGILRMLDSGGNTAFEELAKSLNNDKLRALELVNEMILLSQEEGRSLLNKYIKDKNILEKVLKLIYGPPAPGYVLLHHEMIDIVPVLTKIANWDFRRLDLWQKSLKLKREDFINYAKERFGYADKYAQAIFANIKVLRKEDMRCWISRDEYVVYTVYSEKKSPADEKLILFDNGIAVDKESLKVYFRDGFYARWITPELLVFASEGKIKEKINQGGDSRYAVLLSEDNNVYKAVLLSKPLAQSLFVRLYFLNGAGLKKFKLIHHEENKKWNSNYLLYEINWNGKKEE